MNESTEDKLLLVALLMFVSVVLGFTARSCISPAPCECSESQMVDDKDLESLVLTLWKHRINLFWNEAGTTLQLEDLERGEFISGASWEGLTKRDCLLACIRDQLDFDPSLDPERAPSAKTDAIAKRSTAALKWCELERKDLRRKLMIQEEENTDLRRQIFIARELEK